MSVFNVFKDAIFNHGRNIERINFEKMQMYISDKQNIVINTMNATEQDCLIENTVSFLEEESLFNEMLDNNDVRKNIIVYGKNAVDVTAEKKCKQLVELGFMNVKLYCGGMFEWLLLQDIYGEQMFPTTKKVIDILKWK